MTPRRFLVRLLALFLIALQAAHVPALAGPMGEAIPLCSGGFAPSGTEDGPAAPPAGSMTCALCAVEAASEADPPRLVERPAPRVEHRAIPTGTRRTAAPALDQASARGPPAGA